MSGKSDFELLDAWRGGDAAAGNELFERHFDSVYRFLDRKTSGDAADLVQRVFLGCIEGRDRFRGASSFRTFLFAIARHELYGHWRRNKKQDNLDFTVTSIQDLDPTPSRVALKRQQHQLLVQALRALPLDLQIALELHYWEGMTGPQLAEVLGIPEGTVRSRLRRAREGLEAAVRDLATTPALLESTVSDLDGWARSLQGALAGGGGEAS
jgi:RNA polymerase sigma-70 factor (ECF subfamily)